MDLKLNGVNAASATPERQVLPTAYDHGYDLASLAAARAELGNDARLETMVLDFQDAFMSIPLAAPERPYNTCELERPIFRSRSEVYKDEPEQGHIIAWRVLGFGGKANPLVYSRCAGLAARTAQALLRPSPAAAGSQLAPRGGSKCT